MFTFITGAGALILLVLFHITKDQRRRLREMNQQLNGLRSVNSESLERINVLEGYLRSIERERDNHKNKRFEIEKEFNESLTTIKKLRDSVYDLKSEKEALEDVREKLIQRNQRHVSVENKLRTENVALIDTKDQLRKDLTLLESVAKSAGDNIEELQAQAKIQNGNALRDKDTIFQLKGTIEKLEAEVARQKNLVAEQKELREAVSKPVAVNAIEAVKSLGKSMQALGESLAPTEEVELKDGMWVEAPEGCNDYLTPGKAYKVFKVGKLGNTVYFNFVSDTGDTCLTTLKSSKHLKYQDWKIVPAPIEEVPNTLKKVELPAVAPSEAEELVIYKTGSVGPSYVEIETSVREQLTPKPNIVGNVKRKYQKTGKYNKRK